MIVSSIVAMSQNRVIGKDNKIPWHLPADLKYFKKTTLNHHIILGRKCYESIGRPLPHRTNIVVTRSKTFKAKGCIIVHSIEEGLAYAQDKAEIEVFIAGGGEIYKQSMHLWDKLYLTEVEIEAEGDIYFPKIIDNEWLVHEEKCFLKNDKNPYNYTFKIYEKKTTTNITSY